MTRPTPQQAAVLQAVVDAAGLVDEVDDWPAARTCVALGWLLGDEDGYTLTVEGADALRATQGRSTAEQVMDLLAYDGRPAA